MTDFPDPMPVPAVPDTGEGTSSSTYTPREAGTKLTQVLAEINRVMVGQQRVIERVMVCLLANGHCLLEGPPGLGKTQLLTTLSSTMGGTMSRIQFTPDLLPTDIIGTRIWQAHTQTFDVQLGPVFANFVLADEINRAPAKVQSALLEVMAEQQVTIGGETHKLDLPFLVMATQNPIDSEGVHQLPEAQRDRFMMRVLVDYPASIDEELEIVRRASVGHERVREVISIDEVRALQQATTTVYVDQAVADYAVRIAMATRQPEQFGLPGLSKMIDWGASPRASIAMVQSARALAILRGRGHAEPQDIYDVASDVLNHRIGRSFDAVADEVEIDEILYHILTTVPAPTAPGV